MADASTPPGGDAESRRRSWAAVGVGWAMVADILTGTLLWGGLGFLADRWLDTEPWLMSIGFLVGNATGIYAATLHYRRIQQREAPRAPSTLRIRSQTFPPKDAE